MGAGGRKWEEDETLYLFGVFLFEPASAQRKGSSRLSEIAVLLDRGPNSIHRKIEDIRSNDPAYIERERKPTNCANMVKDVWSELYSESGYGSMIRRIADAYAARSERSSVDLDEQFEIPPGQDIPIESSRRSGQSIFRMMVANNFDRRCCITGLAVPNLLVASHIRPWAESDPYEKTDPSNGLYLNRLHDGLFDRHLMYIDEDMRVQYVDSICTDDETFERMLGPYEGQRIRDPVRTSISEAYLAEHRVIACRNI